MRRRWFSGEYRGGASGMPALLGNSVIVPCASGVDSALKWDAGKISLPHRDATLLSEYVQFALLGRVDVPENCSRDELREIIRCELRKHSLSRARRRDIA